jgi:hypothetical protein
MYKDRKGLGRRSCGVTWKGKGADEMAARYHGIPELRVSPAFTPPGQTWMNIMSFDAQHPEMTSEKVCMIESV